MYTLAARSYMWPLLSLCSLHDLILSTLALSLRGTDTKCTATIPATMPPKLRQACTDNKWHQNMKLMPMHACMIFLLSVSTATYIRFNTEFTCPSWCWYPDLQSWLCWCPRNSLRLNKPDYLILPQHSYTCHSCKLSLAGLSVPWVVRVCRIMEQSAHTSVDSGSMLVSLILCWIHSHFSKRHTRLKRLPITPELLRKMHAVWSQSSWTMLWAACCLRFFGFMRAGKWQDHPSTHVKY